MNSKINTNSGYATLKAVQLGIKASKNSSLVHTNTANTNTANTILDHLGISLFLALWKLKSKKSSTRAHLLITISRC